MLIPGHLTSKQSWQNSLPVSHSSTILVLIQISNDLCIVTSSLGNLGTWFHTGLSTQFWNVHFTIIIIFCSAPSPSLCLLFSSLVTSQSHLQAFSQPTTLHFGVLPGFILCPLSTPRTLPGLRLPTALYIRPASLCSNHWTRGLFIYPIS